MGKDGDKQGQYFEQSKLPFTSFVFVLPLMLVYEAGVFLISERLHGVHNGADVLIREFLGLIGLGKLGLHGLFVSGLFLALVLLFLHQRTGKPWKTNSQVLSGMAAESALYGALLYLGVGLLMRRLSTGFWFSAMLAAADANAVASVSRDPVSTVVLSFGAGVYEELVFRLLFVTLFAGGIRVIFRSPQNWANVLGLVLSAAIFSLFHFVSEPPTMGAFLFRFAAGLFFSGLYNYRGFGIAAGTHAVYDVFVGLLSG